MNETSWDTIFRDSTRFWVQHFCVPVVVLVGVLGNSVTIYILTRKQMRVSANVLVLPSCLFLNHLKKLMVSFNFEQTIYRNPVY